jgi:hypothetical protein
MKAVCVRVPLVPVTVTVLVPVAAVADAVKVNVLAVPVTEAGLKPAVTPAGRALAVRATAPANPPVRVMLIVLAAVAPWVTDTAAGVAASAKSGVATALTVSWIVVVCVSVPLVPVTVTVAGPVVAVADAVKVRCRRPRGGGRVEAATPAGRPLAAERHRVVNPPVRAMLTVVEAVAP